METYKSLSSKNLVESLCQVTKLLSDQRYLKTYVTFIFLWLPLFYKFFLKHCLGGLSDKILLKQAKERVAYSCCPLPLLTR